MKEIWKDVLGWEGYYQISNLGRIKSLIRRGRKKEIILKEGRDRGGYSHVSGYKNKKQKSFLIHRIVLQSFLGKSDLEGNHKDGNKQNNFLENLEYCTPSENIKHSYKIGIKSNVGEKNPRHKLKEWDIKIIRKLYCNTIYWKDKTKLSKLFDTTRTNIYLIVTYKNWSHVA